MDILTINDEPGVYAPNCYYTEASSSIRERPALSETIQSDVCVIGGGYAGLSCALHLAETGVKVILLEANRVGWGASGRNGGQVHIGQRADQMRLETWLGPEKARALWTLSIDAVDLVKTLIQRHAIECEWQDGLIHASLNDQDAKESAEYADHLARHYNYDRLEVLTKETISERINSKIYNGGLSFHDGGHLHALKFALGLANTAVKHGANIFEKSRVDDVSRVSGNWMVSTDKGAVIADRVVFACNGYHNEINTKLSKNVMPINNFIVTTKPLSKMEADDLIPDRSAVSDSNFIVNYYRLTDDNRVLFGGGENYSYRFPQNIKAIAAKRMHKVFPQLASVEIDHAWGGTLGITRSRMPYLHRKNGAYMAAGFSGQGITIATHSGRLIADAISGDTTGFDVMAEIPENHFPGGSLMRWPLLALSMTWYGLRDRFG